MSEHLVAQVAEVLVKTAGPDRQEVFPAVFKMQRGVSAIGRRELELSGSPPAAIRSASADISAVYKYLIVQPILMVVPAQHEVQVFSLCARGQFEPAAVPADAVVGNAVALGLARSAAREQVLHITPVLVVERRFVSAHDASVLRPSTDGGVIRSVRELPPGNFNSLSGGRKGEEKFLRECELELATRDFVLKSRAGEFAVVPFQVPGQGVVRKLYGSIAACRLQRRIHVLGHGFLASPDAQRRGNDPRTEKELSTIHITSAAIGLKRKVGL